MMNPDSGLYSLQEGYKVIDNSELTMVMCHGCGELRPVNSEYAAYLGDGISSCRICRSSGSSGSSGG